MTESELPDLHKDAFICPHCGAYAHQKWYEYVKFGHMMKLSRNDTYNFIIEDGFGDMRVSRCQRCFGSVLWSGQNIIFPGRMIVPQPSELLPPKIREVYTEAGQVLEYSVRASGALIRLSLELLLQHIKKNQERLNANIGLLMKEGIPKKIQKSLDFLRASGNSSVHPKKVNLVEKREDVLFLFGLFNMVCEELIVRPSEIDQAFESLPEKVKEGIHERDEKRP